MFINLPAKEKTVGGFSFMIIYNKNFLVLGLSKSGLAAANLISKYGGNVYYFDDAVDNLKYKKIENLSGADFYCAIKSPGFFKKDILSKINKKGVPVISEIELGYYLCKAPIIAITGTNGKTTTATLLHKILSDFKFNSKLLGNIGTAFCEEADELNYSDCVTLEVSSFQLDYIINFRPHIAAFLNISPDHLDIHKTMESYTAAKMNVFNNMRKTEYAVLNYDCKALIDCIEKIKADTYYFSITDKVKKGCYIENTDILFIDKQPEKVCALSDIKILGKHNVENTLCAVTCAKLMGVDNLSIKNSVSGFMGVANRIEFVRTVNGVSFYNDSKGTNIDAALTAINAMDKKTVLILGGSDKGLDYSLLFKNLSPIVTHCFIYGETALNMVNCAVKERYTSFTLCENLNCAVVKAYNFAGNFGNVLFSPAAASFDSFKNYEERGEYFKQVVNKLV